MLIAWTYHEYVLNVTDSLLFLPSTKGLLARLAQTAFFPSPRFYFFVHHTDSPIVGASDIGQVSTDIGQGFTIQEIPIALTSRRYPRDTFIIIVLNIKDTPKVQDQDVWQDQNVRKIPRPLTRARQTARPS
jgi:hypothetical protein